MFLNFLKNKKSKSKFSSKPNSRSISRSSSRLNSRSNLKSILSFGNIKSIKETRCRSYSGSYIGNIETYLESDSVTSNHYKNVIVYRCISLISKGISSISWTLYESKLDKDHEIFDHPLLSLLQNPNPFYSKSLFLESLVGNLLLSGNSYIKVSDDKEAYVLNPSMMQITQDQNNLPVLYEYSIGNRVERYPIDPITGDSSIIHIKTFNPNDNIYGMSPLEACKLSIGQHDNVGMHNLGLLKNGCRPSGALMIKGHLTSNQKSTLKEDLQRAYEGAKNSGRMMVLEGDMEWRDLGFSPKDLDFVSGKNLSAREIAQAFGVPSMLVGVPGDATFSNYKEARHHLWEDTIIPIIELIIAEFNRHLAPKFDNNYKNLKISYDKDDIQALALRRESVWNNMTKADFLTINEKRAALGYGPIENGNTLCNNFNIQKNKLY